jgi:hypothetical protein
LTDKCLSRGLGPPGLQIAWFHSKRLAVALHSDLLLSAGAEAQVKNP